ncbi:fatty acid cis/trans isomerase [Azomonas macrocytogenes]|uniref:Fatty acid cis/trans isomerase n=1 Tax=Azomonas macrocytogenes TaxID=69962 RepID=A0A839T3Y4_AZOMA|nr:fatty acid cis/trans isomerase [Azomonas macrocytogenes]MBB3103196.1 hypothetical protein [Azomonas macrocytogenes]
MSLRFAWLSWLLCSMGVAAGPLSFQHDIQPILTAKCVACHACYDSPCQLNLGSSAGLLRGATKLPVYDGTRSEPQATTRLFIDAMDESEWRRKGFYSVLDPEPATGQQVALLERMLERGHDQQWQPNSRLPDGLDTSITRRNICPVPGELETFAHDNPQLGMPFAVTGLTTGEYATLQQWLDQGAVVDEHPIQPSPHEQQQIADWETFFNALDPRQELVSRWLYEHLFLAHLYFEEGEAGHFFEWVRSSTPSGQPVVPVATRRPNDDPGPTFYYRLRPVQGVIVRKTHITYPLSEHGLKRIRELFLADNWSADRIPDYSPYHRTSPLATFAAIPALARYQFLLENAEYFVRTFIRGPVCRGQIATDVIRDNFWVLFQAPQQDLYLTDPAYRIRTTPFLTLPGEFGTLGEIPNIWQRFRAQRNTYLNLRRMAYAKAPAPDWSHLWLGNENALLTIFRQYDSASVQKGLIGEIPQTLWLLDFPLLERIYYLLVVNFDVFGNVAHQALTRLHFDMLRNGAEQNFLRLLPADQRQPLLDDWYQGDGKLRLWLDYPTVDSKTPSGLELSGQNAKQDFANALLARSAAVNASPDPINRCQAAVCHRPGLPSDLARAEQLLSTLTGKPASRLQLIEQLPEATVLRVESPGGKREIYSLLRNRAHTNVAFMLGESYRLQPALDTLTLYPGLLSSYPNFIFNIPAGDMPQFVAKLQAVHGNTDFERVVSRWGIRRTHPEFWRYFNDLNTYQQETRPQEAGALDMNRYQNL